MLSFIWLIDSLKGSCLGKEINLEMEANKQRSEIIAGLMSISEILYYNGSIPHYFPPGAVILE